MPDSVSTALLLGGAVIAVDPQRRIIDPGAVAVRGTEIVAVGDRAEIERQYPDAERIDLQHAVILPGLIDSHGHAGHGLTKGIADGYAGVWMGLMEEIYHRATDDEFWRAESFLSALEHIEYGVTTSLSYTGSSPRTDDPRYAVAAASGYTELGLRHIVALGPPGTPWPLMSRDLATGADIAVDLDTSLANTERAIYQLNGMSDGRISAFVAPTSLQRLAKVDPSSSSGGAFDA
jgi:5-methylthioadenosine/S-adenosylhomocysteine deaminase